MRLRIRSVLAAALALIITPIALAVPVSAATATPLTIWHWNVSGWVLNDGRTDTGMVDKVVSEIVNRNADLVALNEICWPQYKAIQSRLATLGWPATTNYSRWASGKVDVCTDFGQAIFSKQPLGTAEIFPLTDATGATGERNMLCAPMRDSRLRFCTAHLTYTGIVDIQLDEVRTRLEKWDDEGDTVVIAGDFNREPDYRKFDSWYSPNVNTAVNSNNTGRFRELDDTEPVCAGYGESTTRGIDPGPCNIGSKIDMIFVPEGRLSHNNRNGDALPLVETCTQGLCSDHRIFYGKVTLNVG